MPEKKTEEQLRQEIVDDYNFDEDDERIDKILEVKKDRYAATQGKKKAQKIAEDITKRKEELKELLKKQGIDPNSGQKTGGDSKEKTDPKGENLSFKDQHALIKADIHDDDIDEVLDYAKYKGITPAEALVTGHIKAYISERTEERKTAGVSNTGKTKRGSSKVSDNALVQNAKEKGAIPESDEDLERLVKTRLNLK